jgi:hypothetical protein
MSLQMKRLTTIVASLLAMFVISACGDDTVTEPSSPNGYLINGDGYTNLDVTATSSIATKLSNSISITEVATIGGELAGVTILVNGIVPGDYTWLGNGNVLVRLTIGTGSSMKSYTGTSGKTTVTSVGNSGGKVVGTYVGTLANDADATKKIEINGKFSAIIQ